jgi:hypothetical protein
MVAHAHLIVHQEHSILIIYTCQYIYNEIDKYLFSLQANWHQTQRYDYSFGMKAMKKHTLWKVRQPHHSSVKNRYDVLLEKAFYIQDKKMQSFVFKTQDSSSNVCPVSY